MFVEQSGAIAQLGERNAGSVEVRSSILLGSTIYNPTKIVRNICPLRLEA
jgi:hypothetical protein